MPRFSVIVPVYNVENYIESCINSVLSQSFADFELILVDDGSQDSSGLVCDSFASADRRVKVIHQPNSGHIVARMNGVKAAEGDYILFLDSDDYWLPGAFAEISNGIAKYGCDLLVFRFGDNIREQGQDFFGGDKPQLSQAEYLKANLHYSGLNGLYNKAVLSRLLRDIDISAFAGFRNAEDMMLSLEIVKRSAKISYMSNTLYFHRVDNPNSITNNFNPAALDEFFASRSALMNELEKLGCVTQQVQQEFYRSFLFCAANNVLQVSTHKLMKKHEKIEQYKKIAAMPFFVQAMQKGDLAKLSKAKSIRLMLLNNKKYGVLLAFDKLRSAIK